MRPRTLLAPVLIAAAAVGVGLPASAATPAKNLLANPDAEVAPTVGPDGVFSTPASWTATVSDGTTQGPYDSCYGGTTSEPDVLTQDVGGAIDGGARFFFAGQNEAAALTQDIPVSPADVAGKKLLIGGFFGGFADQADGAALTVQFLDASGADLGSRVTTPPVTAADRKNETSLVARQASGTVPANTATIRAVIAQTRIDGADNDGYADSLYVTLGSVAPPRATATGDAACAATKSTVPPPAATPKPVLTSVVAGLPSTKRCVSRRAFRIHLRNPKGTTITSASVKVNGKTVATRKGTKATAPVNLKGLPKGKYTVSITTKLATGQTVKGTRRYRTCTPKKKG